MQSFNQIITTNKPTPKLFLQAGCPSCRPTNSVKALKAESITFHRLAHSELTWGFPTLVTLGEGCQASHQQSDACNARYFTENTKQMKKALREKQTLHACSTTTTGCSKVRTPPARQLQTRPQTGPITIHCVTKLSKNTYVFVNKCTQNR